MNTLGCIFARGGSKGVPGKNIRPLAGKPLIAHAIEIALQVSAIERLIVSTDDEEIADVAREYGAEVPFMRPAELAGDNSPEWLAWRHAIESMQAMGHDFDAMVSIPTTSPLRAVEDVERCIEALAAGDTDTVITVTPSGRSPYFNMVSLDEENGYAEVVIPTDVTRRQDVPATYDITTVAYAVRTEHVLEKDGIFAGRVKTVEVPADRALDIDTLLDFEIAEFLMERRLGNTR